MGVRGEGGVLMVLEKWSDAGYLLIIVTATMQDTKATKGY